MADLAWIDAALTAARPKVVAALLRYFRDLDTAEECFQEACLRALKSWPEKGKPHDAAAWLVLAGRNYGIDASRRRHRHDTLAGGLAPDLDDAEGSLVERLDGEQYRDDILRLLFVCCHSALQPVQQIALALRVVSGLTVGQIARAFLVSEAAMEQRITRAKRSIAAAGMPFETPGATERARRLVAVSAMVYLVFNEGYSAPPGEASARTLCDEAIRLAKLLMMLFPREPEIIGLTALLLLQHARAAARFDGAGSIVLLEDQDRGCWDRALIDEGLALIDEAMLHRRSGPYLVQAAIAALHARARRAEDTDWAGIERLYATLESMQPSPIITLNRAVAVAKVRGPGAALALVEPLASRLAGYFHFHGVRGALLMQLGRDDDGQAALAQAITLAGSAAAAAHIRMQLDRLTGTSASARGRPVA